MFDSEETRELLERYGIHAPVSDERFLRHAETDRGTVLRITCRRDERYGTAIVAACAGEEVVRTCPLTREKAAGIVDKLRRRKLIPDRSAEQNTLTNLLIRCCALYAGEKLETLELSPVYLRENDYRVGSAALVPLRAGTVHRRLDPHAHDAGAVFAYRPTARGRNVRNDRPKT